MTDLLDEIIDRVMEHAECVGDLPCIEGREKLRKDLCEFCLFSWKE